MLKKIVVLTLVIVLILPATALAKKYGGAAMPKLGEAKCIQLERQENKVQAEHQHMKQGTQEEQSIRNREQNQERNQPQLRAQEEDQCVNREQRRERNEICSGNKEEDQVRTKEREQNEIRVQAEERNQVREKGQVSAIARTAAKLVRMPEAVRRMRNQISQSSNSLRRIYN